MEGTVRRRSDLDPYALRGSAPPREHSSRTSRNDVARATEMMLG
jgi:hypothetical protein